MTTIGANIRNADEVIAHAIGADNGGNGEAARTTLKFLRDLVEATIVGIAAKTTTRANVLEEEFKRGALIGSKSMILGQAEYRLLQTFHERLQVGTSHFTFDKDSSERLILPYYQYLLALRQLVKDQFGLRILANLEALPLPNNQSQTEYQEKIATAISAAMREPSRDFEQGRYYLRRVRSFFVDGTLYHEVTLSPTVNRPNKFDSHIAFTSIDLTDRHAALLTVQRATIRMYGQTLPILVIREGQVAIRPGEFDNFARLFGQDTRVRSDTKEYACLMQLLTNRGGSLLDLMDLPEDAYQAVRNEATSGTPYPQIFPALDRARELILDAAPGHNVLRYLMYGMRNNVLAAQYSPSRSPKLSNLNLGQGCIPFEEMPFCTSLRNHNPDMDDLGVCLDGSQRRHELLAKEVENKMESSGSVYVRLTDLGEVEEIHGLADAHNQRLFSGHKARALKTHKEHIFIQEHEDNLVTIVERLQKFATSGLPGYSFDARQWLGAHRHQIDDPDKVKAIKKLFANSKVAVVYGAAGTGKTAFLEFVASLFADKSKLFLTKTNPALANLKRKITAENSQFRTLAGHHLTGAHNPPFDLIVIDECSAVTNADLARLLKKTSCGALLLVGDGQQLESIRLGNWFRLIKTMLPEESVFEFTQTFRTENENLHKLWKLVRDCDETIAEWLAHHGYASVPDESLLRQQAEDEIVLALAYEGFYGINNINRFRQAANPNAAVHWGLNTYKVGDPVLFTGDVRFRSVIYNNLKGRIAGISSPGKDLIQFDIDLDTQVAKADVTGKGIVWLSDSRLGFVVRKRGLSDRDVDYRSTVVPFQVAYAVSINKAQGLEYDSVKVVITEANVGVVTPARFYTAITRCRSRLQIYWTPKDQHAVLSNLQARRRPPDVRLLAARRGVKPMRSAKSRKPSAPVAS